MQPKRSHRKYRQTANEEAKRNGKILVKMNKTTKKKSTSFPEEPKKIAKKIRTKEKIVLPTHSHSSKIQQKHTKKNCIKLT